ncbi:hypothetical protein HY413_01480 [Candidatus Kaiserbacteria bacterium]|nr:hypothetical protein [Candidatus Kaiserbacteria bacterium]
MPIWIIALIIAALGGGGALIAFGGFGGSSGSNSDFWTPELCNETLQADIADLEEYQTLYKKAKDNFETGSRRGDATFAGNAEKSMADLKTNTAFILNVVDTETIPQCGRNVFRSELLEKVEAARKFLGGSTPQAVKEEGMPDLRVTSIESKFIPIENDEKGTCSGPYLDITLTVTNYGGDFPRLVDLENYTKRAQQPEDKLEFLFITGELDFGGDMRKSLDFRILGNEGHIPSGGTLKLHSKVRIESNQTHAKAKATLYGNQLLKTGSTASPTYETEFDVPMWDVYAESHMAVGKKDEDDNKYYIYTKAVVTNKGSGATPGPIQGSFIIYDENHRQVSSWSGKTSGPVSGGTDILAKTQSDIKLPPKITVSSTVAPLCPNGESGSLGDGDAKNNIRELQQR